MKPAIIITGPTGVGKTDLVLKLARKLPLQVINADMGQMYQNLTIGTAKPDWRSEPVEHHLFDIISAPQNFSIMQFRERVEELVAKIWQQGQIPVIVGGSTFYIKSLFWLPANAGQNLGQSHMPELEGASSEELWLKLSKLDPDRAEKIHPNDRYRITRALSIWHVSGNLPSSFALDFRPITPDFRLILLSRDRADLYHRIDQRVLEMLQSGWVAEVEALGDDWRRFLEIKKIIGYELILNYLRDEISFAEMVPLIQRRVRNYAKKQLTFWRYLLNSLAQNADMQKQVFELNLSSIELDLGVDQIVNSLKL